ncbi:ATP-binding protein [Actinoplanes sp. NPDC023936]|uniref:NACHT domain-containing protein n=1 Tax=Actinoplanes sp. NPDC023936 TaxID=3154910 RepID=UPI0033FE0151
MSIFVSRIPPMTYAEALRIVARDDQRISRLDRALGAFLLAAAPFTAGATLALIDPKTELISQIRQATDTSPGRIKSTTGKTHLELLEAAHTMLGLSSFFDAFEAVAGDLYRDLELSPAERQLITDRGLNDPFTGQLRTESFPLPTPRRGFDANTVMVRHSYAVLANSLMRFMSDIAAWERRRPGDPSTFVEPLTSRATEIYRERFMRLAVDVPEFGFWMQTNFASVITGSLAELKESLNAIGAAGAVNAVERKLERRTQAVLTEPIWPTRLAGLAFPTVEDGFVSPDFRLAEMSAEPTLASDDWWMKAPLLRDLAGFLADYLTSPESARRPLVVLGHPGAGKTLLSKVVAARIPADSFTTILVKLREVPTGVPLYRQIEAALEATVEESVDWGSLCRESARTKVVIFDGLDELIQATKTPQTEFIERVTEFQRGLWLDGTAVITVVTSRHIVMDQVSVPPEALVIRLEDFSDAQLHRWVEIWNHTNLETPSFHPLAAEAVIDRERALRQPLLVALLAIYAAGDGGRRLDDPALAGAGLYKELISSFITRQIRDKATTPLSRDEQRNGERALRRNLSIAAFAMFNRGEQEISEDQLSDDLEILTRESPEARTGRGGSLNRVKATVAAFFFVHVAKAGQSRGETPLENYEFLHATFGEYLVAEYTVHILAVLAGDHQRLTAEWRVDSLDDDLLFALLSQRALAAREPVVDFARHLMKSIDNESLRATLMYLFDRAREPRNRSDVVRYAPTSADVVNRLATYTANLATLLALSSDEGVPIEPLKTWSTTVRLWRAGLDEGEQAWLFGSLARMNDRLNLLAGQTGNLDAAAAELIADYESEVNSRTGDMIWAGTSQVGQDQRDYRLTIYGLLTERWPVPALRMMTPPDVNQYQMLLEFDGTTTPPIDPASAQALLNLLVDDGPYLPADLTRALVRLALDTLADVSPRDYTLQALAHRCPYLMNENFFVRAISTDYSSRTPLGFVLMKISARQNPNAWTEDLLSGTSPADWIPEDLSSVSVSPEMVHELAGCSISDSFAIHLLQLLSRYGELSWEHVEPHDLHRLLDNRPDLDVAEVSDAVSSYLAHKRAMGTPESDLDPLLFFAADERP